jgi:cell division protein FtsI (penicillin-binding protein 3)
LTDDVDPFDPYGMFGGPVRTDARPARPSRPTSGSARGASRSTASRAERTTTPGPRPVRPPARPARPTRPSVRPVPRRAAARAARSSRDPVRRLRAVLVLFAFLLMAVIGRLAQLQVIDQDRLASLGAEQRTRSIEVAADRGSVLDRSGNDLALSLPMQTVWTDPSLVAEPADAAAALAPVLGLPVADVLAALTTPGRFANVAHQVTDEVAEGVAELGLEGVYLREEPARFHPGGDLLRSVLGTTNVDNTGRTGIEAQYDALLTGDPGERVFERDPNGRTIPGSEHEVEGARAGDDLVLTIDRGMQYAAESALATQIEAMGASGGTVIVTVPGTGEILAMANLQVPEDGGPPRPTSNNLALTTVFEPGSVNKVITVAAALEEGIVSPTSVLTVPDRLQVSDHLFTDHDPHATAQWTPTDILATSSNIGTIMLGRELGPERIDSYLRRFGFGTRTALDFPNESPGLLLPVDDWSGTSIGSIPIGQGIAVTAMQMLAAYNVIANDGVYVEPRLLQATIDADGNQVDVAPSASERVVSETTARAVRDMMVAVVDAGTGSQAAIDGYSVAGKTGTARKPQDNGTYQDAAGNYHYVTTFAGFVPAQDPQLSIIVVVDEPTASTYASAVSAPVFAELAQYALRQFRIPPPAEPHVSTVPEPTAAEEPIVVVADDDEPVRNQPAIATTTTTTATTAPSTSSTTTPGRSGGPPGP